MFMNFFSKRELVLFVVVLFVSFFFLLFFENPNIFCPDKSAFVINYNNWEVYFCPEDFCSSQLISKINLAEDSIFVAIYSFTHKDIADALILAKKRGVDVIVVMDFLQSTSQHSVHNLLIENSVPVFIKRDSGVMHNKFMIIDNSSVFTGSFNYSLNADRRNDENLVFIFDKELAKKFVLKFNNLVVSAS